MLDSPTQPGIKSCLDSPTQPGIKSCLDSPTQPGIKSCLESLTQPGIKFCLDIYINNCTMYNVHTVATPLSSFVDVATESVVHICFYVAADIQYFRC